MNKAKMTQSFKKNSISSVIIIAVFSIIYLVFFVVKGTGEWPLEIWGIIAIFISIIYSIAYQTLGGSATNLDEVKS
ncbi:MAG: hypothetical protein H7641_07955 [Candidatus Heimdallarchaeota archaeon]|nr:hypothetical protein [Candidatus Heimdallarchaeota archaeon]MCK4877497.1 hypothetical protein [Candidatus Heimdallarchaeota archaeon]